MPDTASLYHRDWYAWTRDQAARPRACPDHLRPDGLNVEHLAEEVESLDKSDQRAIEAHLRLIALHLPRMEFHPGATGARPHWMAEVDGFRGEVERLFEDSPSLHAQREAVFAKAWRSAERDLRPSSAERRRTMSAPSPRWSRWMPRRATTSTPKS